MRSWKQPTNEVIEKTLATVKKETDRQYFFSRLKNPLWIEPLRKQGYFNSPPGAKHLPDGYVQYPSWPELSYLVAIANEATNEIIEIVLAFPKTDNPRVYADILKIALELEGQESARLLPKLIECTELDDLFLSHHYPDILSHWATQGNTDEALEIVKKLIPFREDPRSRAKQQLRKEDPNSPRTLLEPAPRFDKWHYKQILEKGVRPLAENEPYQVASILIDATASMIRMKTHPENLDKGQDEDYSEIWCRRLDMPDSDYQDAKSTLVHTLNYACKQVYVKAPESIEALDQALRNQPWKLFKRLRQQLYATNPSDQTLPWIRELIIGYDEYSKWEYRYEFQLMIRKASEHFGSSLLSEDERSAIFDAIISGPSQKDFRESMAERYSDEAFQQRQRHFHRKQLHPFAALLSGKYQRYLDELEEEAQTEAITDESYSPSSGVRGGFVSFRSPKSAEDLENFKDEELLTYLNKWDNEHRDKDDWLVEINIAALAGAFQSLFKNRIVSDRERLAYWMEHRDKITRPIYIASMVKAMQEVIKDKDFVKLDQWIEFCDWILSHPDSERVEGQPEPRDESPDHPDWGSSRRAVVDFIDTCVNKDTDLPMSESTRDGLAKLLQRVCNQFDWRLDRDRPVLLNRDEPFTEAINNTRSRALGSLFEFGSWIRRQSKDDPVQEVTNTLSIRIAREAEFPLTRPEHALIGTYFGSLCAFNRDWSVKKREILFPRGNQLVWRAAFVGFILHNRPSKAMFEILREDFEYALKNLVYLTATEDDGKAFIDSLGQHLFAYYIWQIYPLKGDESLLARFYDKTSEDRSSWGELFDHVGRSLKNSGKHLDKELTDRAIAFFEWRFNAAEPLELREFTFWLDAECLDPEWRLRAYSNILDLGYVNDMGVSIELEILNKLLPDHLPLVVECFSKITHVYLDKGSYMYISADEAKPILRAGLTAGDSQVHENAELARENLLRNSRFDFLDVE